MTTKIGSLAVSLSLDASNFNGSMAQVDRNLRTMGSELKAAKALGADYGNSLDGLRSKKDILTRSVEASSIKLSEERKKYDELVESGKASEAQLERQAKKVNDAQAGYNRLTTELGQVDAELKRQSSSWTQYGEKMESAGKKMQTVGKGMSEVGDSLTKKVTLPLAGLGAGAFKAAVDFESAFAGVRKTVDGTEAEFTILSSGIRDMAKEIPAAATEIAMVGEAAGQLGIEKEAILGFTRTMVDLGVATNMTSDEAATALARLANITQMNQQDFDRLGSSVVELGNNFATTEGEIVDMALRLAGAGAQVGMSEADILALAAALSSVGIEAEMGGSAISRVMVNMQVATSTGFTKVQELMKKTGMSLRDLQMMASHDGKGFGELAESLSMTKKEMNALVNAGLDLQGFSKVAGMTGEQFKKAFEEDAIGALGLFINGLANAEEAGESAINMLQEMGITEIRLRDSLLRAGGASELFANAVQLSNDAWVDNNALTKEAEERYKTTASQMKMLWNQIVDIGITMGNVLIPVAQDAMNKFKPLVETFAEMDKEQHKTILTMGLLAASIGPTLKVTGNLTTTLGGTLLMAGNLSKGIGAAGGLVPALAAIAGPTAIAVGALAAVSAAGYGLYKVLNQTSIPEIDIFGNKVSENTKKAVGAFTELTDEATIQLNQLKWSGVAVTKDMATGIINSYSKMGESVLAEMQTDHAAQLESARSYLTASVSLTEEEQKGLLAKVTDGQAAREEAIRTAQTQYSSILQNAADERRSITALEQETLDRLQREMMETGIKYLSETEQESLVILERLKLESGKINAEQAIETADRAREARDAVVDEAEKKYEETIAFAMMLKEDGSKESEELYKKIVEDAGRTRDEVVAAAEGQYEAIIRTAKEKGDEYVTETELRLGQVMTLWQKAGWDISLEVGRFSAQVVGDMRGMSVDSAKWLTNLKNDSIGAFTGLVRGSELAINKLPGIVKSMLSNAAKEAAKSIDEFFKVGEDIVEGLKRGMAKKAAEVTAESYKLGKSMVESISKSIGRQSPAKEFIKVAEDAGAGLIVGMNNQKGAVSDVVAELGKVMVDVSRKNAEEVNKIASKAANDRAAIQSASATKLESIKRSNSSKLEKIEQDKHFKLAKVNEKASADMVKKANELSKKRLDAVKLFVEDKKSLEQISVVDEVIIWQTAVDKFKAGTKEKVESQKAYAKALDQVNKEITTINKKYADQMQKINDDFQKQEEDLTKKYQDTLESRMKSLYSFAGVFDEFDTKIYQSGVVLLENLRGQVKGFEDWQSTIEKLAKRAVDDGLIAELTAMGPKALGALQALNSMTDEQLSEYSSLYLEKQALARSQAEAELIGMKNDTEKQIGELRAVANTQLSALQTDWQKEIKAISNNTAKELTSLKKIGEDAVRGLIEGMKSMHPDLKATANSLAQTVGGTVKDSLKIKSPSRVMIGYGENVAEGLGIGIGNKAKYATDAAKDMVRGLDGLLIQGVKDTNAKIAEVEKKAAEDLLNEQQKWFDKMDQFREDRRGADGKVRKNSTYDDVMNDYYWSMKVEMEEIERQKNAEIERLQSTSNKIKLEDVKRYFEEKKKAENLSYMDELYFWEETIKLYEDGTAEKIEIQKEYQKVLDQINQELQKSYDDSMSVIKNGISEIDNFGKELMSAISGRYASELENAVAKNESYFNKILEPLRAAQKALDEQFDAEDNADKMAGLRNNLAAARTEKDRQRIQKLIDEEEKRWNREQQKQAIAAEIEKAESAKNEAEKGIKEKYELLMSAESVEHEARKLVLENNEKEIESLLKSFNPNWQNAGQSFGQKIIEGLNSMKTPMQNAIQDMVSLAYGAMNGLVDLDKLAIKNALNVEGVDLSDLINYGEAQKPIRTNAVNRAGTPAMQQPIILQANIELDGEVVATQTFDYTNALLGNSTTSTMRYSGVKG